MVPYFSGHHCKQLIRWRYKFLVDASRLSYINWFEFYEEYSGEDVQNDTCSQSDFTIILQYADVLRKIDIQSIIFCKNAM